MQGSKGAEEQRSRRAIGTGKSESEHPRTPAPLHPCAKAPLLPCIDYGRE